jgi:hypothetical protein
MESYLDILNIRKVENFLKFTNLSARYIYMQVTCWDLVKWQGCNHGRQVWHSFLKEIKINKPITRMHINSRCDHMKYSFYSRCYLQHNNLRADFATMDIKTLFSRSTIYTIANLHM